MPLRAHMSLSTCGQTLALTSPRWALWRRSIVRDWPIPAPIERDLVAHDRLVVRKLEEVQLARVLQLPDERLFCDADRRPTSARGAAW